MKLKKGERIIYIGRRKQSADKPVNGDKGVVIREVDSDKVAVKWDRVGEFITYKRYVTFPAAE